MTQIVAFSGKKQSGKNTCANFLVALQLANLGVCQGFNVYQNGDIFVSDIYGEPMPVGSVFNIFNESEDFIRWRQRDLDPFFKMYSCADLLKNVVCIQVLGLSYEQVHGTDEQKNTETRFSWKDMPGVFTSKKVYDQLKKNNPTIAKRFIYHKDGPMTAREVMQYVGTDVFRRMYGNVWSDALIREIRSDGAEYAFVTDIRFENEAQAVLDEGGQLIRLTRNIFEEQDSHSSETALDDYKKFSVVIDNHNMTISEANEALYQYLVREGVIADTLRGN